MLHVIVLGRVSTTVKAGIPNVVLRSLVCLEPYSHINFVNIVPSLSNLGFGTTTHSPTQNSTEIICDSIFKSKYFAVSISYLFVVFNCIRKNPDSPIHIHLPDPIALFLLLIFKRRNKIIVSYHADLLNRGFLVSIYNFFILQLLKHEPLFVFPTIKHYSSTFLNDKKINKKILPYLFPKPPISHHRSKLIDESYASSVTKVLFVGRHVPYKGIPILIKAFSLLSNDINVSLDISGKGPLTHELVQLALGDSRINFLGEVSDEELHNLYASSHILVLPSITRAEAFGLVQVEAMLCHCLCLSSDLQNGVNIVNRDGVSGFSFQVADYLHLSQLIARLASDISLRNNMMKKAHDYAVDEFTSPRILSEYISLYK